MNFWDERYGQPEYAYGKEPNEFLAAEARRIPKGRVLCLAEGQGRNAVFLAQLGYEVLAVDQSRVGLEKAHALAEERGVRIQTRVADLGEFEIETEAWHGIISISAHLPPALRMRVHRGVVGGLARGGVFLLEAYSPRQHEIGGFGGPPRGQAEMLMSLEVLREELSGLSLLVGQEVEREVNEGVYHRGRSGVVQVVALKG